MYEDFETSFKAWRMNQIEAQPRKRTENGYAQGNDNAIKLPDNEVDCIITRILSGEKIKDIYLSTYQGICTIDAIRARVRKRNIKLRKPRDQQ